MGKNKKIQKKYKRASMLAKALRDYKVESQDSQLLTNAKQLRPLGDILLDMEPLWFEMVEHGLQKGDILALTNVWADVHTDCGEKYTNGSPSPIMYYGPLKRKG